MTPRVMSVPFASVRAPRPQSAPIQVPISGNRKSVQRKNPYINPAPRPAPRMAPTIPMTRLYSPCSFGFFATGAIGRTAVMGVGADGIGGGVVAGTGDAAGIGGGGLENVWARMPLAAAVPSAPQTGQPTFTGIRPFIGS